MKVRIELTEVGILRGIDNILLANIHLYLPVT